MACNLCSTLLNNFGGQQQRSTLGLAQGARRTYRGWAEELVCTAHSLIEILLLHCHIMRRHRALASKYALLLALPRRNTGQEKQACLLLRGCH